MSTYPDVQDLRDLPPPGPMVAIMDALDQPLPACGYLAFLLPRFPQPLLSMLEERGLHYHAEPADDYRGLLMLIGHNLPETPDED